jgi:hypothetical protein
MLESLEWKPIDRSKELFSFGWHKNPQEIFEQYHRKAVKEKNIMLYRKWEGQDD